MNPRTILLLAAVLVASPLLAREKTDVVVMKNGDRITCEIKGLGSDTLYISVDYILGTISVDWSKVDHIESNQLFIVKTQDGSVHTGAVSISEPVSGRPVQIEVLEAPGQTAMIDRAQVIDLSQTDRSFWRQWDGQVGLSVAYSKGNQATQYNLNSDLNYSQERWSAGAKATSNLTSNSGSSTTTRNTFSIAAERLLPWNNWYYTGAVGFLQSSVQGIKLQSTFGGGIGRYVKNTGGTSLGVFGGFAWQQLNYEPTVLSADTQRVTSGLIGTNFRLARFDRTSLIISANLLPAISDSGRVHFNLNSSYYVKLWRDINWNFTFYGNWDNRPPPSFSTSDYGTTAGLSWSFGNR